MSEPFTPIPLARYFITTDAAIHRGIYDFTRKDGRYSGHVVADRFNQTHRRYGIKSDDLYETRQGALDVAWEVNPETGMPINLKP